MGNFHLSLSHTHTHTHAHTQEHSKPIQVLGHIQCNTAVIHDCSPQRDKVDLNSTFNGCIHFYVCVSSIFSHDTGYKYDAVASERLGRSDSYQEQYVFVYR